MKKTAWSVVWVGLAFTFGLVVGKTIPNAVRATDGANELVIDQKHGNTNKHSVYDIYRVTNTESGVEFGTPAPPDRQPVIVTINDRGTRRAYYGVPRD